MASQTPSKPRPGRTQSFKNRVHEVVFEADTPAGKAFDIALMVCILLSAVVVVLDSVQSFHDQYGAVFNAIEWGLTFLFTIEYIVRLYCLRKPWRYATSFFGIIDLLAVTPSYASLFVAEDGTHFFVLIRALRLLRIFRVLKLTRYLGEAQVLLKALRDSRPKIIIFIGTVMILVVNLGALMYLVEGGLEGSGFTNIPKSIYWAIVTLTTVGYGDIAPQTALGQIISSLVMILGYGIIAVPTGIVSAELVQTYTNTSTQTSTQACPSCGEEGHDNNAIHCKYCGAPLEP